MTTPKLPNLPHSWSELTWQQLCACWSVKMRYGAHADVARVAALLALLGCSMCVNASDVFTTLSGEKLYRLRDKDGCQWTLTAREAAYLAKQALPWFDYPYGDPGEKEQRDDKGEVIRERREAVSGYVSPMRDAMILPKEEIIVSGSRFQVINKHFALPQVACNNLTWQQYRSLQAIEPRLHADGMTDEQVLGVQAQFMAHCLVPRSLALLDTTGGSIRLRPHWEYRYNAEQAERLAKWFEKKLKKESNMVQGSRFNVQGSGSTFNHSLSTLFHVCFQTYQTAIVYYATSYPLLFADDGKKDPLRDALTGEVGTINTIMKYAGYAEQQQVYDSNLPFVLDILNAMTKEAKEIEKMNSKIKKK